MNRRRLREIIELGENDRVEFKRRFSDFEKIAKEMIAFANTRGGVLLIGVDDDGTVIGVDSEKHEIELVQTAGEFYCSPEIDADIEIFEIGGEDVLVITIPESYQKPHYLVSNGNGSEINGDPREPAKTRSRMRPQAYIRQDDRSVAASREVEKVMAADHPDAPPMRIHIGKIERTLFDYLESNPRITLREYRHLVNISERRASRILVRLVQAGLIRIFTEEAEDYYTLV